MTTIDLRNLSPEARNERVNEAVAVHCAGFRLIGCELYDVGPYRGPGSSKRSDGVWISDGVPFATSADAVLPLLEKQLGFCCEMVIAGFTVTVSRRGEPTDNNPLAHYREVGTAKTFPLAACIALLRAAGIEVTT